MISWLRQVTTILGGSALLPTVVAWIAGAMSPETAIPLILSGAVAMVWPENKTPALVHQITSILGSSAVVGAVAAVLSGALAWPAAIPILIGAAMAVLFPDKVQMPSASTLRALALLLAPGGLLLALAGCGGVAGALSTAGGIVSGANAAYSFAKDVNDGLVLTQSIVCGAWGGYYADVEAGRAKIPDAVKSEADELADFCSSKPIGTVPLVTIARLWGVVQKLNASQGPPA